MSRYIRIKRSQFSSLPPPARFLKLIKPLFTPCFLPNDGSCLCLYCYCSIHTYRVHPDKTGVSDYFSRCTYLYAFWTCQLMWGGQL